MSNKSRYLYNTIDPSCDVNTTFVVDDAPVILRTIGLLPTDVLPVEVMLAGLCTRNGRACLDSPYEHWTPLISGGCPAALTGASTMYIELMPGTYRVDVSSLPPAQQVAILASEIEDHKNRVSYCIPASNCSPADLAASTCPPAAPVGLVTSWG